MLPLLLALQLTTPPATPPDSATAVLKTQIDSTIAAFLLDWRGMWGTPQYFRQPYQERGSDTRTTLFRLAAAHCHHVASPVREWGTNQTRALVERFMIRSAANAQATCPLWLPADAGNPVDERRSVDGGLQPRMRQEAQTKRAQLREFLDGAALALPNDVELTGQRVRFALDALAQTDAWRIASECAGDDVACGKLRGYVLYRGGKVAEADLTFQTVASVMTEAERCAWNDVGVLLEPELRQAYAALACADRLALEARLWWLADPLWLDRGNERRAEHFARRVMVQLLTHLPHDGRQHFTQNAGGDAVIESLLRYGWPTQLWWPGYAVDRAHWSFLHAVHADSASPYVVREYSYDRLHTVPPASLLRAPFTAPAGAWPINGPSDRYDWWPVEHFARDRGPIVELREGQLAQLRRREAARLLWATSLDTAHVRRRSGEELTFVVFDSRGPARVQQVGTQRARAGSPLRVDLPLPRGDALMGVELSGGFARPSLRARFGVDVAAPLSAMRAGQRAVSQPLLFEPSEDAPSRLHAEDAVARMYATTTFARASRLGVYWEGYGFTASDTIEVEVSVVREDRPGLLARAAGAVGLVGSSDAHVAVRWRDEPGTVRGIQSREGSVPLQMRNVVIDVSRLTPGAYVLGISMRSGRGAPVRSTRKLVLR